MAASATSAHPQSQYHHFIPRFILRNFSHPFTLPKQQKRAKRKQKPSYRAGEPMLHGINLANATAEIVETPVSKTFGLTDMYRDFSHNSNQHYIEDQLSRLESRAGEIVSNIRKAFEAGQPDVWLTRADRDTLRKFVFIMKYRGRGFHRRFYHQNAEGYSSDDKEMLTRYMREKGFQKPIDVWFDNIKAMLEIKMDPRLKWMDVLRKRAYPPDAEWFINNTQSFYLALCTPNYQDDEFLLTENAYSIHEGPGSLQSDPDTGELTTKCYTEYHVFAPISAKLIIVLRSFLLPSPVEDANEETREFRQTMLNMTTIQHNVPDTATSILEDLPVTKARNSYSKLVDGRIVLLDGETGAWQARHKFCFRFFPISTDHVQIINVVMLQEACETSVIAFKSVSGARRALEFYLGMSCERGFKIVGNAADDPRLAYLKQLEQAARELGSSAIAVYEKQEVKVMNEEEKFEVLGQKFARAMPKKRNDTMALYAKLGGSPKTLPKDMDQARKMLNMRIKVDVWTQGVVESVREEIREKVRDLFCQYALPRRVWLYLKQIRHMKLAGITIDSTAAGGNGKGKGSGKAVDSKYGDPVMDGPEDVIANVTQVFRDGNALCHAMYQATLNDILLIKNPDYGILKKLALDAEGMRCFQEEIYLVFGPSGSICDCGIPRIEAHANFSKDFLLATELYAASAKPVLTVEQNVETAVRIVVRDSFKDIFESAVVSPAELEALEEVLFEVVYPDFGWRCN